MGNYLKSEFEDENYKSSKIAEAVKEAAEKKSKLFLLNPYIFNVFPEFISRSDKLSGYYSCMVRFNKSYIDLIKNSDNDDKNTSHYLSEFLKSVESFAESLIIANNTKKTIDQKRYNGEQIIDFSSDGKEAILSNAKSMVESFQNLSSLGIFSNNYTVLLNYYFRHYSKFLSKLICPDKVDYYKYKGHKYYFFNIMDPFVCAAALRIMNSFSSNINTIADNSNEYHLLSKLRRSMFIRLAEKEFTRHFYIEGMTYKVALNNEIGGVVASPFYELSSIDDFKPIRLYEKIVLYIIGYLKNKKITSSDEIIINISIVGHTEPTYKVENDSKISITECELNDLVEAILKWWSIWSELPENESSVPNCLNIIIDNYYHEAGITNVLTNSKKIALQDDMQIRHPITKENEDGSIGVTISQNPTNFEEFEYNYDQLEYLIDHNNLVFLIDCPFLFEENYKLRRAVSFRNYCERINKNAESFRDLDTPGIDDPENRSNMDILSNQYNRLMATGTKDTGDICRVFRESWFNLINEQIKRSSNDKLLYLYSSERFGINYSEISLIPLSRVEHYDKKSFNIYQFHANKIDPMESHDIDDNHDKSINAFYISLWSTLKYSSIEFAYTDFKKSIIEAFGKKCITEVFVDPIDYFVLLNNVFTKVNFNIDKNNNQTINVCISFALSPNIDENDIPSDLKTIIINLIIELYNKVYFCKNSVGFADAQLRNGFIINLYNSAHNVDMINYWHQYRMFCMSESKPEFDFVFKMDPNYSKEEWDKVDIQTSIECSLEYFKDKRLYDLLLMNLEKTEHLGYEINTMLEGADKYYNYSDKAANLLLNNIINSQIKIFKGRETKSYTNAKKLL